jgi:diguanylate cyclase (GGDEF)-like protein/PAS domain S-box-containing protein
VSIRTRLIALILSAAAAFVAIVLYGLSVYRQTLEAEERLVDSVNRTVELAYQSESLFYSQLNAWKNVLLRGKDGGVYHRYLSEFYRLERKAAQAIEALKEQLSDTSGSRQLASEMMEAHQEMGRRLREALLVFNSTTFLAGEVADRFVAGQEHLPSELLGKIVTQLQEERNARLDELALSRTEQQMRLTWLSIGVAVFFILVFLWQIDKSIGRPAHRAAELADIVNTAERVARFGTWNWQSSRNDHHWSEGLYRILGLEEDVVPGLESYLSMLHREDRDRVRRTIADAMKNDLPFELETRVVLPDGRERVVQQRGQVVRARGRHGSRMTSILYDVTERVESGKRMTYLANYDALTGLPNRNLFQDRVQHAVAQASRNDSRVALLYLDLDRFKAVNDALGHDAGDELLKETARRIKRTIRESDTAARLGGDEFTILIEGFESNTQISVVAEHVLAVLNESYRIRGQEVFVSASLGIGVFPGDGTDLSTLMKNADAAMYLAKEEGRNGYHFFTKDLNRRANERLMLENSLRMAQERDEYQVYFQPQLELNSGRVVGMEALLRWVPDQNQVSPSRFLPVLEETGLIVPVGRWVLEQACRAGKSFENSGLVGCHVAVNFSSRQLRQVDVVKDVERALERSGLLPSQLEIEVTERTLAELDTAHQYLERLVKLGIRLAIDDFGTGYSSLSHLQRYSVDTLKIDRSFIRDITRDKNDNEVTGAVVALAHELGMRVVAEGVETSEQLNFLKNLKCDRVQGFYFGRPMLQADLQRWLARHQTVPSGPAVRLPG